MITLTPVKSSQLKAIGYDIERQELLVEFIHGGLYTYIGVPSDVHTALMAAESPGSYLGKNIKGAYAFVRPDGTIVPAGVAPAKAAAPEKPAAAAVTAGPAIAPVEANETEFGWPDVLAAMAAANPTAKTLLPEQPMTLTGAADLRWFAYLLQACTDDLIELDQEHAERRAPLVNQVQAVLRYFGPQAEQITRETVPALGGRKSLDAGSYRFGLTAQAARIEVTDADAALAWADTNLPTAVVTIPAQSIPERRSIDFAAVSLEWKTKGAKPEAIPAGFQFVPEVQKFSIKPITTKGEA